MKEKRTKKLDIPSLQPNNVMRENWGKSFYPIQRQVRWCSPDNKTLYEENIKKNFKLMKALGFVDSHINGDFNYSFNEYGFRSDSFDNKCTILFNGCSQTMGMGLSLQDIWSKKIADHYNVNYHNIALGGTDFGHMAQRSVYWLYKLKPKYHIVKETALTRYNWWRNNSIQSTAKQLKPVNDILDIALDNDNTEWARYSSLKVIKSVCDELNTKLLVLPPGIIMHEQNIAHNYTYAGLDEDLARDLIHYGREEQHRSYQYIIDKEFIKI